MESMIQHNNSPSRRILRPSACRLLRPSHPYRRVSYVDPMYLKHDDSLGDFSGFLKEVALLPPLHDQLDSRDAQLYKHPNQPELQGDKGVNVAEPELEGRPPGRIVGKLFSQKRLFIMLIILFIFVVALWFSDS
ncbi:hypothetical protein K435DRAFT_855185 [Dendrothele bispora CBS 962.96]|uniref:Uncharacterized protein n=1 Tax=Dendrothele bispora (strain CBS 962.96) TaxID=1314807 RepID=A0A4S8MBR3_DENBC|nr:hypothetical protein K435DRAFT_855185 [Dendrothele bispora CBS 962.96]